MKRAYRATARLLAVIIFCSALAPMRAAHAATPVVNNNKQLVRAQRAVRAGDFEGAEKMYRELLSKNSQDTAARLGLSFALLKQRKFRDAFDAAARVVATDPTSARAHALIGSALLGTGDFRLSVEEFRTALSFQPDEALAIAGLAMVDFYENRLTPSVMGLRRAVSLDSGEPDYYYSLGQVAARSERYAEAADAYEQFLRIAPRTDVDRRDRIRGLVEFLRYLGTQDELLNVEGPSVARVPFELVNNRPVVQVRINGSKETLKFVVDTGAGMCVVAERTAQRLGLKPVARGGKARAVGGVGHFEIVYGFVSTLQFGETKVERVPVFIREFYNEENPVDGYIGLSVLTKYLTAVDYGSRSMTLTRNTARTPFDPASQPPGFEIPIRTTSSGFWSGEVQIDGITRPLNFIIDTGASISVVSEDLAAREEMGRFSQNIKLRVYGAAGIAENVQMLLLPRVGLGTHTRTNVTVAVLDLNSINETAGFEHTGIIGGNVLRHFRVIFDFQRAIVRFEQFGPPVAPVTNEKATTGGITD